MEINLLKGVPTSLFESHYFTELFGTTHQWFVPLALICLIFLKPIATGLTVGAGGSGGIFAPSLYTGGLVGFLVGLIFQWIYPEAPVNLSHFTLVGMCGVMSGVLHAPLTAIFLIATCSFWLVVGTHSTRPKRFAQRWVFKVSIRS